MLRLLETRRPIVEVVLAAAVAVTARLVAFLVVWLREHHRSARAYEMTRRLPPGSSYVEDGVYVRIDIGKADSWPGAAVASGVNAKGGDA